MFGNFLYFIVALLITTTYQPGEETNFRLVESALLFFGLIVLFTGITRATFQRIERRLATDSFARLDHLFNSAVTRQSVLAVVVFAVDIYGLNLSAFLTRVPVFQVFPTLQALLFIALFTGYLAVVWAFAYDVQRELYHAAISRKAYVGSNIAFAVPVLLPWFLLSVVADLIHALPFAAPGRLLDSTTWQVLYFLFFLLLVAVVGPAMIQKFWRCKPLDPGYQRSRIEALCRKADMRYAEILYWPIFGGRMITAGVMGLVRRFRYLLVTRALLQMLAPEEIDAVVAHEIGHVKRRHLLFYLFFFTGYLLLSFATFDLIVYTLLYSRPLYGLISSLGLNQTTVTSVLFSLVMIALFLFYFRFIFGFFMRNFERQADCFVYSLFNSAAPLISTLQTIARTSGQPPEKPNWHHFSISQRIDYLRRCEADRSWITRQDRKIRKGIGVYLAGILLVAAVGYHLNFGETGRRLNAHFMENIILGELEKNPQNPGLLSMLGDLRYAAKRYPEAIRAYVQALRLNPEDAQVLNNLAWLYATCEDPALRDPDRALALAQAAARLDPTAHVLDTLAESYFVSGRLEEAVAVAARALALARSNRSYYEDQLRKFREAADRQGGLAPASAARTARQPIRLVAALG
jgi:Zn-dependent protease with chaperone function